MWRRRAPPPDVLVPGVSCSELEARLADAYRPSVPRCGAMKGKGMVRAVGELLGPPRARLCAVLHGADEPRLRPRHQRLPRPGRRRDTRAQFRLLEMIPEEPTTYVRHSPVREEKISLKNPVNPISRFY